MSLESGGFIKDLVETNPEGSDPKSAGDDHLRLLKHVLKTQFAGFTQGIPMTRTESELNAMMIAGSYGLGGDAIKFTDPNLVAGVTGFFACQGGTVNLPPGALLGDTMIQVVYGALAKTQLWQRFTDGQLFGRSWNNSAWTAWQPLLFGVRQANRLDLTAGAILPVGAFGLGGRQDATVPYNLDSAVLATFFGGMVSGMVGTPPPGWALGDVFLNVCYNTLVIYQLFWVGGTQTLWSRLTVNGGSTWTTWLAVSGIGVGQVWTSQLGSRLFNTAYTNSTQRPIQVMVSAIGTANSATTIEAVAGGVSLGKTSITENAAGAYTGLFGALTFIVPAGAQYHIQANAAATLISWAELR